MKTTIVDFISAGSGGGGGSTGGGGLDIGAQTGDLLLSVIWALIALIVVSATVLYFRKVYLSNATTSGTSNSVMNMMLSRKKTILVIGIIVSVALVVGLGFNCVQKAIAAENDDVNVSVPEKIYGHVNEDTGQVTFDAIEIKNNDDMITAMKALSFTKFDDVYDGNCIWTIKSGDDVVVSTQADDVETLFNSQIVMRPGNSVTLELSCNMDAKHAISLIDKSVITINWNIIAGGILTWDETTSNIEKVTDETGRTIYNGEVVDADSMVYAKVNNSISTPNCLFTVKSSGGSVDTKIFPKKGTCDFAMPKNDAEIYAVNSDGGSEFYAKYDTNNNTLSFYYDSNYNYVANDEIIYRQDKFDFDYHSDDFWGSENWPYHDVREDVVRVVVDSSVQDFYGFKSLFGMFGDFEHLMEFSGIEYLRTDFVTDMSYTFHYIGMSNSNFNTIPNVSNWDTSNVVNMSNMFYQYATTWPDSIDSVPDVSKWNTSKVKDFSNMFASYADGSLVLNVVPDVSNWDTSSAEDMSWMFSSYGGDNEAFNQVPNVSKWNTGSVKTFDSMFAGYAFDSTSLDSIPDVGTWDVTACIDFVNMFFEYGKHSKELSKVPNVSDWRFGSDVDISAIFSNYARESEHLNDVPDVSDWNMEGVINIEEVFSRYNDDTANSILDKVPNVEGWNVSSATSFYALFYYYGSQSMHLSANFNLSGWDTKSVKDLSSMFNGFAKSSGEYSSVDLSSFNVPEGVSVASIFRNTKINQFKIGGGWKSTFKNYLPYTDWTMNGGSERYSVGLIDHLITSGQIVQTTTFDAVINGNGELANVKDSNDIYTPDPSINYADNITLNFSVPSGQTFNYWVGKSEYYAQDYNKVAEGSNVQEWTDTYFSERKFEPEYDKFNLNSDGKTLEYYYEDVRPAGYSFFYKVTLSPNNPDMFLEWSLGNHVVEKETYNNPGHFADILGDSQTSLECSGAWSTDTYTVKFNANDFEGEPPVKQTVKIGESITIPGGGMLHEEHKSFDYWSDKPGWDQTEEYYPGDTFTPDKNTTLYANFVNDAEIRYHADGHSGTAPDTQYKEKGVPIQLAENTFLPKAGEVEFLFWVTDDWYPRLGEKHEAGEWYDVDESIDLYPYFAKEGENYKISYNANGATGTCPPSIEKYKGEVINLADKGDLKKDNLDFLYWNTASDGSGTSYKAGSSLLVNESLNLYAIWGGILTGTVVDANNQGIGNVDVSAYNNEGTLIAKTKTSTEATNGAGYYEFSLTEGTQGYIVLEKEGYFSINENFGPITGSISKNYTMHETTLNFTIQFVKEQGPNPGPIPGPIPIFIDGAATGDYSGMLILALLVIAISAGGFVLYKKYNGNNKKTAFTISSESIKSISVVKVSIIALAIIMLVACTLGASLFVKSNIAIAKYVSGDSNIIKAHVYDNGRIDIDDAYFANLSNKAIEAKTAKVSLIEGVQGASDLENCKVVIEGLGGTIFEDFPSDAVHEITDNVNKLDGGKGETFLISIYDLDPELARSLDGTVAYSVSIVFDYPE